MCQWNGRELLHISCWKFIDFSLSRNLFDLDTYLLKRKVLRASKRDLEREISITVDRNWIFFLLKFSKYSQNKEQRLVDLEEFFLAYQDRLKELSIHSIKIVIRFFRAIKLCKRFYKLLHSTRNYYLCKFWSIDVTSCFDFRYFWSHGLSCKSWWTHQWGFGVRCYFGPWIHVTKTQGFV